MSRVSSRCAVANVCSRFKRSVSVGDVVLLGPDSLGAFVPTAVKSIQRKRVNVQSAEAGQSVSFALKRIKRTAVRKGATGLNGYHNRLCLRLVVHNRHGLAGQD